MVESSPILPPNRRGIMTPSTILPIILALFFVLILRKYYFSIIKKIEKINDIDIEKQKWGETETKVDEEKQKEADKERFWLIRHQKDLEETLAKIEKITKQKGEIGWDYFAENILKLAKKLSHFLDKEDRGGKEFDCFEHLLTCYYFKKPELEEYIIAFRSQYAEHQKELQKDKDELQKKQDELLQKQQELELREAKIIKIEASQKILNSELVEKINKEID
jgi:hypothetical protein